jgi:tetratricopeptide (TPR) repeat protein
MTAPFVEGPLRDAFRHLFNSDLEASQAAVELHRRDAPHDPLGTAISAAVRFYHYVSLRIPERDTPSIVGVLLGAGVPMPAAMQKEIGALLRKTQTLAGASDSVNSILALSIVESVNRDGMAIVSKRWGKALAHAERAHELAGKMLKLDPAAHDGYFVLGSTEYLLSRIPGPVRGFISLGGASGDKKKAIAFCNTAAGSGWFFREFARRTLVNLYVEEGRPDEAEKILGDLTEEFPGNPMLRADLMKLRADLAKRRG